MTDLGREFDRFARYLGVERTSEPMRAYYARTVVRLAPAPEGQFEATLLRWAVRHPALVALADAYARRLLPFGVLRRRLVLTLAILESSPPSYTQMHTSVRASGLVTWWWLAVAGVRAVVVALLAVAVFAPAHAVHALGKRP